MTWRVAILLICFASPALANTVVIESGEHPDFSRLVLALPSPQDWQFGRTATGYELALGADGQRFDVSTVFELIPKDRLTGIFVDPTSGRLQLTVACNCHALPFSLDERTIVIDLRDGPPPERSVFEQGLGGGTFLPLENDSVSSLRPRSRMQAETPPPAFDWLTLPMTALPQPSMLNIAPEVDTAGSIQDALVTQLAEGAARGVVDLALPTTETPQNAPFLPEGVPIRLTSTPGLQIGDQRVGGDLLNPVGDTCIPEDALDLASWGDSLNVQGQLATLHTDIVGEFDEPQRDAVLRAARLYVFLGFGAEARSLLNAFAADSAETRVLLDLARVIDAEPLGATHAFSGMATCNTAAALWSFLALSSAPPSDANMDAIKRSFSALPAHLRLHLGPSLVQQLIDLSEMDVAHEISTAMGRGSADDERASLLVQAELALATGASEAAAQGAEAVLADASQRGPHALVTLIDAKIMSGERIDPALAETALAMIEEHEGLPLQKALRRSYVLALAGSGQFSQAFAVLAASNLSDSNVWSLLAENGSDDDVLTLALTPPDGGVTVETAALIADRLKTLGFLDAAEMWRQPTTATDPPEEAAAPDTASQNSSEDMMPDLSASVAENSANGPPAADLREAGSVIAPEADRTQIWAQNWPAVAAKDDDAWGQLAQQLLPSDANQTLGPLAAATDLLTESQSTRQLIDTLLAETAAVRE